jgi:hypothetical protein
MDAATRSAACAWGASVQLSNFDGMLTAWLGRDGLLHQCELSLAVLGANLPASLLFAVGWMGVATVFVGQPTWVPCRPSRQLRPSCKQMPGFRGPCCCCCRAIPPGVPPTLGAPAAAPAAAATLQGPYRTCYCCQAVPWGHYCCCRAIPPGTTKTALMRHKVYECT